MSKSSLKMTVTEVPVTTTSALSGLGAVVSSSARVTTSTVSVSGVGKPIPFTVRVKVSVLPSVSDPGTVAVVIALAASGS